MTENKAFILLKEQPDGNGRGYPPKQIAVSKSKEFLIHYAELEFGVPPIVEEGDATEENYINGDFWSGFLFIEPTTIKII